MELRDLVKRFGDFTAVADVSLAVERGELVTLLGPSGSGKTTTLNVISGFTDVTAGEIVMDERAITLLPPHRRNIGMVFQNYALFPHMTAFDNIAFPLRQRRVTQHEIRRRVEDALALVQLEHRAKSYPRQLSGGQQQRIALARAIVYSPRLLLMDEPLGALDKKLRESLQLEIKHIQRQLGITVVYVTHDQEEALVLSDRIAVFNAGRIEQVGTAPELYERPSSVFVADFIGESNMFRGRMGQRNGVATLESDGLRLWAPDPAELSAGSHGVIVVRPERVFVRRDDASEIDGHNLLSGTVREVIYLGSARKLAVELASGQLVTAREQAGSTLAAREGDRVLVSWAAADSVLLADDVGGER